MLTTEVDEMTLHQSTEVAGRNMAPVRPSRGRAVPFDRRPIPLADVSRICDIVVGIHHYLLQLSRDCRSLV